MVRETRHLSIRNLPESATEEKLETLFKRHGKIQRLKLVRDEETNVPQQAFVSFVDIISASKAHNANNKLDNRNLRTDYRETTALATESEDDRPLAICVRNSPARSAGRSPFSILLPCASSVAVWVWDNEIGPTTAPSTKDNVTPTSKSLSGSLSDSNESSVFLRESTSVKKKSTHLVDNVSDNNSVVEDVTVSSESIGHIERKKRLLACIEPSENISKLRQHNSSGGSIKSKSLSLGLHGAKEIGSAIPLKTIDATSSLINRNLTDPRRNSSSLDEVCSSSSYPLHYNHHHHHRHRSNSSSMHTSLSSFLSESGISSSGVIDTSLNSDINNVNSLTSQDVHSTSQRSDEHNSNEVSSSSDKVSCNSLANDVLRTSKDCAANITGPSSPLVLPLPEFAASLYASSKSLSTSSFIHSSSSSSSSSSSFSPLPLSSASAIGGTTNNMMNSSNFSSSSIVASHCQQTAAFSSASLSNTSPTAATNTSTSLHHFHSSSHQPPSPSSHTTSKELQSQPSVPLTSPNGNSIMSPLGNLSPSNIQVPKRLRAKSTDSKIEVTTSDMLFNQSDIKSTTSTKLQNKQHDHAGDVTANSISFNNLPLSPGLTSPTKMSIEDRIKALDDKYIPWSGSSATNNVVSTLGSSSSIITNKSSDIHVNLLTSTILSTSTTSLSSSIAGTPSSTPTVDYSKYNIKKKSQIHPLSSANSQRTEPSDIARSLLSKSSIFDQDSKRLEHINEKYEPRDVLTENISPQIKPTFRTKAAAKEFSTPLAEDKLLTGVSVSTSEATVSATTISDSKSTVTSSSTIPLLNHSHHQPPSLNRTKLSEPSKLTSMAANKKKLPPNNPMPSASPIVSDKLKLNSLGTSNVDLSKVKEEKKQLKEDRIPKLSDKIIAKDKEKLKVKQLQQQHIYTSSNQNTEVKLDKKSDYVKEKWKDKVLKKDKEKEKTKLSKEEKKPSEKEKNRDNCEKLEDKVTNRHKFFNSVSVSLPVNSNSTSSDNKSASTTSGVSSSNHNQIPLTRNLSEPAKSASSSITTKKKLTSNPSTTSSTSSSASTVVSGTLASDKPKANTKSNLDPLKHKEEKRLIKKDDKKEGSKGIDKLSKEKVKSKHSDLHSESKFEKKQSEHQQSLSKEQKLKERDKEKCKKEKEKTDKDKNKSSKEKFKDEKKSVCSEKEKEKSKEKEKEKNKKCDDEEDNDEKFDIKKWNKARNELKKLGVEEGMYLSMYDKVKARSSHNQSLKEAKDLDAMKQKFDVLKQSRAKREDRGSRNSDDESETGDSEGENSNHATSLASRITQRKSSISKKRKRIIDSLSSSSSSNDEREDDVVSKSLVSSHKKAKKQATSKKVDSDSDSISDFETLLASSILNSTNNKKPQEPIYSTDSDDDVSFASLKSPKHLPKISAPLSTTTHKQSSDSCEEKIKIKSKEKKKKAFISHHSSDEKSDGSSSRSVFSTGSATITSKLKMLKEEKQARDRRLEEDVSTPFTTNTCSVHASNSLGSKPSKKLSLKTDDDEKTPLLFSSSSSSAHTHRTKIPRKLDSDDSEKGKRRKLAKKKKKNKSTLSHSLAGEKSINRFKEHSVSDLTNAKEHVKEHSFKEHKNISKEHLKESKDHSKDHLAHTTPSVFKQQLVTSTISATKEEKLHHYHDSHHHHHEKTSNCSQSIDDLFSIDKIKLKEDVKRTDNDNDKSIQKLSPPKPSFKAIHKLETSSDDEVKPKSVKKRRKSSFLYQSSEENVNQITSDNASDLSTSSTNVNKMKEEKSIRERRFEEEAAIETQRLEAELKSDENWKLFKGDESLFDEIIAPSVAEKVETIEVEEKPGIKSDTCMFESIMNPSDDAKEALSPDIMSDAFKFDDSKDCEIDDQRKLEDDLAVSALLQEMSGSTSDIVKEPEPFIDRLESHAPELDEIGHMNLIGNDDEHPLQIVEESQDDSPLKIDVSESSSSSLSSSSSSSVMERNEPDKEMLKCTESNSSIKFPSEIQKQTSISSNKENKEENKVETKSKEEKIRQTIKQEFSCKEKTSSFAECHTQPEIVIEEKSKEVKVNVEKVQEKVDVVEEKASIDKVKDEKATIKSKDEKIISETLKEEKVVSETVKEEKIKEKTVFEDKIVVEEKILDEKSKTTNISSPAKSSSESETITTSTTTTAVSTTTVTTVSTTASVKTSSILSARLDKKNEETTSNSNKLKCNNSVTNSHINTVHPFKSVQPTSITCTSAPSNVHSSFNENTTLGHQEKIDLKKRRGRKKKVSGNDAVKSEFDIPSKQKGERVFLSLAIPSTSTSTSSDKQGYDARKSLSPYDVFEFRDSDEECTPSLPLDSIHCTSFISDSNLKSASKTVEVKQQQSQSQASTQQQHSVFPPSQQPQSVYQNQQAQQHTHQSASINASEPIEEKRNEDELASKNENQDSASNKEYVTELSHHGKLSITIRLHPKDNDKDGKDAHSTAEVVKTSKALLSSPDNEKSLSQASVISSTSTSTAPSFNVTSNVTSSTVASNIDSLSSVNDEGLSIASSDNSNSGSTTTSAKPTRKSARLMSKASKTIIDEVIEDVVKGVASHPKSESSSSKGNKRLTRSSKKVDYIYEDEDEFNHDNRNESLDSEGKLGDGKNLLRLFRITRSAAKGSNNADNGDANVSATSLSTSMSLSTTTSTIPTTSTTTTSVSSVKETSLSPTSSTSENNQKRQALPVFKVELPKIQSSSSCSKVNEKKQEMNISDAPTSNVQAQPNSSINTLPLHENTEPDSRSSPAALVYPVPGILTPVNKVSEPNSAISSAINLSLSLSRGTTASSTHQQPAILSNIAATKTSPILTTSLTTSPSTSTFPTTQTLSAVLTSQQLSASESTSSSTLPVSQSTNLSVPAPTLTPTVAALSGSIATSTSESFVSSTATKITPTITNATASDLSKVSNSFPFSSAITSTNNNNNNTSITPVIATAVSSAPVSSIISAPLVVPTSKGSATVTITASDTPSISSAHSVAANNTIIHNSFANAQNSTSTIVSAVTTISDIKPSLPSPVLAPPPLSNTIPISAFHETRCIPSVSERIHNSTMPMKLKTGKGYIDDSIGPNYSSQNAVFASNLGHRESVSSNTNNNNSSSNNNNNNNNNNSLSGNQHQPVDVSYPRPCNRSNSTSVSEEKPTRPTIISPKESPPISGQVLSQQHLIPSLMPYKQSTHTASPIEPNKPQQQAQQKQQQPTQSILGLSTQPTQHQPRSLPQSVLQCPATITSSQPPPPPTAKDFFSIYSGLHPLGVQLPPELRVLPHYPLHCADLRAHEAQARAAAAMSLQSRYPYPGFSPLQLTNDNQPNEHTHRPSHAPPPQRCNDGKQSPSQAPIPLKNYKTKTEPDKDSSLKQSSIDHHARSVVLDEAELSSRRQNSLQSMQPPPPPPLAPLRILTGIPYPLRQLPPHLLSPHERYTDSPAMVHAYHQNRSLVQPALPPPSHHPALVKPEGIKSPSVMNPEERGNKAVTAFNKQFNSGDSMTRQTLFGIPGTNSPVPSYLEARRSPHQSALSPSALNYRREALTPSQNQPPPNSESSIVSDLNRKMLKAHSYHPMRESPLPLGLSTSLHGDGSKIMPSLGHPPHLPLSSLGPLSGDDEATVAAMRRLHSFPPMGSEAALPHAPPPAHAMSQPNIHPQTPPHASAVPPQGYSLLLERYPVVWQGLLALKNDQAAVRMHFVSGSLRIAHASLPQVMADSGTPPIKIAQRMRLEQAQLEGVARKMQMVDEHCMLLALPTGRDHMDILQQSNNLRNGLITYLQSKQAAGIVNSSAPGSQQAAYVIHIFPSCEFSSENLARIAPDLLHSVTEIAHLLIIIATV